MIKSLQVLSVYKSLVPQLWGKIPDFSVITGLNGTGKSHLLEGINNFIIGQAKARSSFRIPVEFGSERKVKYVPAGFSPNSIYNNSTNPLVQLEKNRATLIAMIRAETKITPQFETLVREIKKELGDSFKDLDNGQLLESIPPDFSLYLQDSFNNMYISEVFRDYQDRVESYKCNTYHDEGPRLSEKEIYKKIGVLPPWTLINNLFTKYCFNYQLSVPTGNLLTLLALLI